MRSSDEAGEKGVEALGEGQASLYVRVLGIADEGRGLEGGEGFEPFATSDGECAALVRT